MEKVTEYKVIRQRSIEPLETEVNELIGQGWQPHGPLLKVPINKSGSAMIQPMVKYEKPKTGGK